MAPVPQLKVGRYLGALALVLVAAYTLIAVQGWTPKLGLDLRGGTSVILTPKVEGGGQVSTDQLNQAISIIRNRVNGSGVAEAEVVRQGQNIVISVPGAGRDVVQSLGSTAQLAFRPVIQATAGAPAPLPTGTPEPTPSGVPSAAPSASAGPAASASPLPSASPTSNGRPLAAPLVGAAATASPAPSASASPAAPATPVATSSASPATGGDGLLVTGTPGDAATLAQLDCSDPKVRAGSGGIDKPDVQIVACLQDGGEKYLLGPAVIVGTEVAGASATLNTQQLQGWTVNLQFKSKGQRQFTDYTRANVGQHFAIVLDGAVVSAPNINEAIPGDAQITGNFTESEAKNLANVLKYGALPLTFETSQAETISAVLGGDQLDAGLLAGGIGLLLVVVYSLLYYRGLGLVTIASLAVAGAMTYASVVLLGEQLGFTLTLAGIAGLIVSIGITADSFVVYFERVKDEVRDGRELRSAADRGWIRARQTIINADFVSLLAAAILYFLSVGAVRGFAFTLGLVTVIDVIVVFTFTRPLVTLIARSKRLSSPAFTGLGHALAAPAPGAPGRSRAATTTKGA